MNQTIRMRAWTKLAIAGDWTHCSLQQLWWKIFPEFERWGEFYSYGRPMNENGIIQWSGKRGGVGGNETLYVENEYYA